MQTLEKATSDQGEPFTISYAITPEGQLKIQKEMKLRREYAPKTPFILPLADTIAVPHADFAVYKYWAGSLRSKYAPRWLSRPAIKQVARAALEALRALHQDGLVHTHVDVYAIKVRRGDGELFKAVYLSNLNHVTHQDSEAARRGHPIGARRGPRRSPELLLGLPWGTSTDIWSFGSLILDLLLDYQLFDVFRQAATPEDVTYPLAVFERMHKFFGPSPDALQRMRPSGPGMPSAIASLAACLDRYGPPKTPFHLVSERAVPRADNEFLRKIMVLNPAARPTAEQLLDDEWWTEESQDTRDRDHGILS